MKLQSYVSPVWLKSYCLLVLTAPSTLYAQSFECLLQPKQTVEISSPVAGIVKSVAVRRGDTVKKGQVIATLESNVEQAAMEVARLRSQSTGSILSAQKKIEFAKVKFERLKYMAEQRLVSGQERDNAEAELRLAQAELKIAEENRQVAAREYTQQASLVSQRVLRSPFDGVVQDRLLSPGELTESSGVKKAILKLAQINPLRVNLILPEALFGRLKIGGNVKVQPQYQAAPELTAKVTQIDRMIDAASGTFTVFLEIPNPTLSIPAGMRCKVDL